MLSSGTLSIASPGLSITGEYAVLGFAASLVAGNNVWQQYSWSAPGSAQFAGFGYTSAWFQAEDTEATGGESIGFKGSGGECADRPQFPLDQRLLDHRGRLAANMGRDGRPRRDQLHRAWRNRGLLRDHRQQHRPELQQR